MRPSRPPTPPPEPPRDTRFGGLTLIERIAVGGMAEVFRAREPRGAGEPRTIVVKRMLPHIAAEPSAARMFEAEARIGRLVTHPNVVGVLAFGQADGQPYLSLELVGGVDLGRLRTWLAREERRLDLQLALFVGAELLAGLHAVHEARDENGHPLEIVHGDVSPSNVLLSTEGDVKLADFGIAQARLRTSFPQAAASSSRLRGKLAYLSPEQVRGEGTDRRSDVFTAAAVIAEIVLGEPLFARESDLSTLLAIRDAHLGPLEERGSLLPAGMFEVLSRGLARDPDARFATAAEFGAALAGFLAHRREVLRAQLGALIAEASGRLVAAQAPLSRDDVTIEPPLTDHWVRKADGSQLGPWTFAQLVEAITVGKLSAQDHVRVEGGRFRRIADMDGLAAHLPRVDRPSRETEPAQADGIFELATGKIVEAFARAAAERADGVWIFRRREARKEIFLVRGAPEFVTSNVPEDLLGEFLVARGALTRGELDMALAVLPRFDGRLGDTLSALGLMEPVEVFRHLADQVHEKLLALFTWTEGQARFSAGVAPPKRGFPLGLDPWRLLLEGIERRLAAGLEQDTFAQHLTDDLERTRVRPPAGVPAEIDQLLLATARPRPLYEVADALADPRERDVHRPYRAIRLGLALGVVGWA